jgi:hypothetical protein
MTEVVWGSQSRKKSENRQHLILIMENLPDTNKYEEEYRYNNNIFNKTINVTIIRFAAKTVNELLILALV